MRKVFLSFLILLFFTNYGIAQTERSSALEEKEQSYSSSINNKGLSVKIGELEQKQIPFELIESENAISSPQNKKVVTVEISTEERAFIDNLKRTDIEQYKEYLRTKSDIKSLENSLSNSEKMDDTLKEQLSIKLEGLKSKYDFK